MHQESSKQKQSHNLLARFVFCFCLQIWKVFALPKSQSHMAKHKGKRCHLRHIWLRWCLVFPKKIICFWHSDSPFYSAWAVTLWCLEARRFCSFHFLLLAPEWRESVLILCPTYQYFFCPDRFYAKYIIFCFDNNFFVIVWQTKKSWL